MPDVADLVRLVGLQPVQGIAVLMRVDRDRRDAHLEGGAERANGDLPAVGDEPTLEIPAVTVHSQPSENLRPGRFPPIR